MPTSDQTKNGEPDKVGVVFSLSVIFRINPRWGHIYGESGLAEYTISAEDGTADGSSFVDIQRRKVRPARLTSRNSCEVPRRRE